MVNQQPLDVATECYHGRVSLPRSIGVRIADKKKTRITAAGANAPICHGAGIRHNTLSDLVREINYVDANGMTQSVSDPDLLRAAAGAFGLLGEESQYCVF